MQTMPRLIANRRRGPVHDWYLKDWMKSLEVNQAELGRRLELDKSSIHGIYHGRTQYYRELLNQIASALHLQPYELLMHPEDAMAIRNVQQALRVIEGSKRLRAVDEAADQDEAATG